MRFFYTTSTTHTACKTCDYLAQATALSDQCTRLSFGLVVHGCLQLGLSLYEAKRIILNCDHIFVCTDIEWLPRFLQLRRAGGVLPGLARKNEFFHDAWELKK